LQRVGLWKQLYQLHIRFEVGQKSSYILQTECGLCFGHAFRITTASTGDCRTFGTAIICCHLHAGNFVSDGARTGVGRGLAGGSRSARQPSSLSCSPGSSARGSQHRFVLRRSFFTHGKQEAHPTEMQAQLGHSDIRTTLNIYTQTLDGEVLHMANEVTNRLLRLGKEAEPGSIQ
jgi:hypothetical protein